jgi:hypothetical protein
MNSQWLKWFIDLLDSIDSSVAGATYTDAEARAAVGTILQDSTTINFTWSPGVPSVTADLLFNPVIDRLYPVGTIYITTDSTNPGDPSKLNRGTWAAFGAGRVLVGRDSGDTDFDTAEETGGAKSQTLVHSGADVDDHASHTHDIASSLATPDLFAADASGAGVSGRTGGPSATLSHTVTQADDHSVSVVQPYIVVYMWKRTA